MSQPTVYVGIDVAHAELVVALRAPDTPAVCWTVANDAAGLAMPRRQLQRRAPALIVLEATGASSGSSRAPSAPRAYR